eukprot:TRINITY_DN63550_c0_g1_i1.p1 TRINITY_DN63550_c0_g1~~TRINITY_DN63550_c0_g1_i1.p1  ORF type:complete len:245 (-),score=37.61 TRINITY_DN63550_c0_g1_i1:123-857(-)
MAFARAFLLTIASLQGAAVLGDETTDNVFGQPMTACGSDHEAGCTYAAMDSGAHQVCVTKLPHGFSSDTGQGPWSDEFTGQPWCICIWAYSNYILQNKDLPLRCESIPAVVLDGKYSMDKFKQCGSMSSTEGCGSEDIRRSIQSLCEQCDAQAPDDTSKQALKGKCDGILAAAPAAPMTLYSIKANAKAVLQSTGGASPLALGVLGLSLAAVAVGVATRKLRVGSTQQGGERQNSEALLEDAVE